MRQDTKSLINIGIIVLVIVALFYSGYIPYHRYVEKQIEAFSEIGQESFGPFGYIQPQVVDGYTEEPLEGAVVVIPEINQKYRTNAQGLTADIRIPIKEDPAFKDILPKPWGEVTLIVYKEGYIDYVLFHTHVWENQGRKGPRILLFPEKEGESSHPMAIVEGPHRLWVNELVKKYKE